MFGGNGDVRGARVPTPGQFRQRGGEGLLRKLRSARIKKIAILVVFEIDQQQLHALQISGQIVLGGPRRHKLIYLGPVHFGSAGNRMLCDQSTCTSNRHNDKFNCTRISTCRACQQFCRIHLVQPTPLSIHFLWLS